MLQKLVKIWDGFQNKALKKVSEKQSVFIKLKIYSKYYA